MRWLCAALLLTGCVLEAVAPGGGMRIPVLRPSGIVTQPNKYGTYAPGALSVAKNVHLRDPGIIGSLPAVRTYQADVISGDFTLRRLFAGDSSVLALGNSSATWAARWVTDASSATITAPSGQAWGFDTGKAHMLKMRDRFFVTADADVIAVGTEGSTSARAAGIPRPRMSVSGDLITGTGDEVAIENGRAVNYVAVLKKKSADGYEIVSAPTNVLTVENNSGSTGDSRFTVAFGSDFGIEAGDTAELYRTRSVASGSEPGATFLLCASDVADSSDIAAGSIIVRDSTPEASLGRELYTNPGVAGENGPKKPNFPPPAAMDVVTFKGHAFYFGTTEPASIALHIPSTCGALSTDAERTRGIGSRTITGDRTDTSATIANISDSHMLGLVPGQSLESSVGGFAALSVIVSVGSNSITLDGTATSTSVGDTYVFNDVLDVDGNDVALDPERGYAEIARLVQGNPVAMNFIADEPIKEGAADGPSFSIGHARVSSGSFTIRATNGQNYSPALPEIDETALTVATNARENRVHWSKGQLPEAVPPLDTFFVGSGEIYRAIATRDAIYVFASDGLHRISGAGGVWRVDPVDPTLILAARNAVDAMHDAVWAYTNRGLVAIANDSVQEVSTGVIGDLVLPAKFSDTWETFLACDELHREAWLTFWDSAGENSVSYVFNTLSKAFVTVDDDEWSCMTYSRALRSLVIGADPNHQADENNSPDVLYFEDDDSATRMGSAELRFQPLDAGDPFTLKEFQDADFIFAGSAAAMTMVPSFDGTNHGTASVPASALESRARVPVPRNAPAVGPRIAPGFTLSAGGTTQAWSFRGLSVRFVNVSEEGGAR